MSDLYSVIPSLTPSVDDVTAAELLAKQILEAKFPDLDLREGTGLRDLVLRPTAYAMALLKAANDYYFANNTLRGVNDSTDTEIVDDILSNWFVTRHTGNQAIISARLYFAVQKNITVPSSTYFSTDNTLRFFPTSTLTFPANALSYDSYQNEWYLDVELIAEQAGSSYNIGEGSLLYFTNFDPYFLHADINFLSIEATDPETNSQFISRSKSAVSTRNLINNPSVVSNLQESFNTLTRIVPVGMGDSDMIRDQIKVVFDPETPRLLTALSRSGTVATATLFEHKFEVGQIINIVGANPVGFNGQFSITAKDLNTFQFTVSSGLGAVTTLPTVQSTTSPCLVHTGGKVDVYCGDTVSSNIIQLTTDSDGVAVLTGPIYSFSRSPITGGSSNDSIPASTTISTNSVALDTTAKLLHVSCPTPHTLTNGALVQVSGVSQSQTITSLSCVNLVVTAVCAGHGLTTGTSVTVSGVIPSTYNGTFIITVIDANTFTYSVSINILQTGTGGSMRILNPVVDGTFAIIYTGTSTFDISMPGAWSIGTVSTGSTQITYSVPYTTTNPYLQTVSITSLTGTGTTATATLMNHGFVANRYITIAGATPSYYNGTWKITNVLSSSQFTFNISSTILSAASGTITGTYVTPWYDYGFSDNQTLRINFGPGFPNSTASFQTQYFTNVDSVQQYLESPNNHVLCGDYLARGFNLYVLDLDIVVYNSAAPSSGAAHVAAQGYLDTLAAGGSFILSDLVSALTASGISNIQTPLGVSYTYFHRDLVNPITGAVVDYLDPLDKTSVFILGNITTSTLGI